MYGKETDPLIIGHCTSLVHRIQRQSDEKSCAKAGYSLKVQQLAANRWEFHPQVG